MKRAFPVFVGLFVVFFFLHPFIEVENKNRSGEFNHGTSNT